MPMTGKEHLAWCKERALEILESGEVAGAYASMISDMGKHDDTRGHVALELGGMLFISGNLSTGAQMKDFIEGFN